MTDTFPQPEPVAPFLRACRGLPTDYTPVWFMRQAGRYMAEYRELRAKYTLLEMIRSPELAAQVTLQPIQAFDLDAAIIFADILPPLVGMGLQLQFVKGEGPQIDNPLRRPYDIDRLATPPAQETLSPTLEAIRLVAAELAPRNIPLIGFAGAPFTLASYAIEGGSSRNYSRTKALMYSEPAAWKRLMVKLVTVQADYLLAQAKAGATALQVFDSWAGQALGRDDYRRFVQPYNRMLFEMLRRAGAPVINFSTGAAAYIDEVAAAGGDVIGVDWRMPLGWYWERIGYGRAIQGNLDPALLLAPWRELRYQIDALLAEAAGRPGHIFNLGHGILPETPVDMVRRVVDYVHEQTRGATADRIPEAADHPKAENRSEEIENSPARATTSYFLSPTSSESHRPLRYPIGVLIMAYGGPNSLDDIPGYLADIRSGRPTPAAVLEEITHNYQQIGGKSPLLEISRQQTAAVAAQLDPALFRCYLGMRHWSPWIEEVVGQMVEDGITHAVSLVLAPHFSKLSVAKYQERIADGLKMAHGKITFEHIASYHDAPKYIEALANRVVEGLVAWPEAERERVHVVFSAHSLPTRILSMGDPYDSQLRETARLVAARVGLPDERWSWSYQSAGRSPEPWLGPQLEEHLPVLADRGIRDVISIPVGFVSDHVEILYDIDMKAQEVAHGLGMKLVRPPALNTEPLYIATLVDLVRERTAQWLPATAQA